MTLEKQITVVMYMVALYTHKGVIEAMIFLMAAGYTQEDAVELIAVYDNIMQSVRDHDTLPVLNH